MDVGLVVLGGLLAILGGLGGSVVLGRIENAREEAREKRDHKAAVRAVLFELAANLAMIEGAAISRENWSLTTIAHDTLLLPFYGRLPDDLAMKVSLVYGMTHSTPSGPGQLVTALPNIRATQLSLRQYAVVELRLRFPGEVIP
jgi:hypothetical protein